jgi:GDP-L-fucose synthase
MEKVLVTGATGLVGSSIVRQLKLNENYHVTGLGSKDCDLRDASAVAGIFNKIGPTKLILAAARVGGVLANSKYPATFLIDNLLMEASVLKWLQTSNNVTRVVFIGSSCIYPVNSQQPMKPESLMTGTLEPTNRWYAVAKLAGIYGLEGLKLENGISGTSLLPTNLYGPGDNFHETDGHVLPSLLKRFFEAKQNNQPEVVVWGTGTPIREFLYVDDLASAVVSVLETINPDLIYNVGSEFEVSIAELASTIAEIVGYKGRIVFDSTKPDGANRKHLDFEPLKQLGWEQTVSLKSGISRTLDWYQRNLDSIRAEGVKNK